MSKKDTNPVFTTVTSKTRTTLNTNLDLREPNQRDRFLSDLHKATRRTYGGSDPRRKRTSE